MSSIGTSGKEKSALFAKRVPESRRLLGQKGLIISASFLILFQTFIFMLFYVTQKTTAYLYLYALSLSATISAIAYIYFSVIKPFNQITALFQSVSKKKGSFSTEELAISDSRIKALAEVLYEA